MIILATIQPFPGIDIDSCGVEAETTTAIHHPTTKGILYPSSDTPDKLGDYADLPPNYNLLINYTLST
jgi:hypothetical protein